MTEERCRDCKVFGGEGPPCVPDHEWGPDGVYQRDTGRPCPRVELERENNESRRLVWFGMHEPTRPLMAALAQKILDKEPPVVGRGIISRAAGCLLSPRVISFMYPPAKGASGAGVTGEQKHTQNLRKAHSNKPMQPVNARAVRSTATAPPPPPSPGRKNMS